MLPAVIAEPRGWNKSCFAGARHELAPALGR
jgi:hypothetical protein